MKDIKEGAQHMWENTKDKVSAATGIDKDTTLGEAQRNAKVGAENMWEKAKDKVADVTGLNKDSTLRDAENKAESMAQDVKDRVGNISKQDIKESVSSAWEQAKDTAKDASATATEGVRKMADKVERTIRDVADDASLGQNAEAEEKGILGKMAETVKDAASTVKDAANRFIGRKD